jgi:ubiquinone/menaquinone biosynthesis C-methylase UbiE
MKKLPDYISINKQTWNNKTEVHIDSEFYDNVGFLQGKQTLNSFELDLLQDLKGKRILHLQCHFGQDSMNLSRMGAEVTGVDFSETGIKCAEEFAEKLGLETTFICCDVYDAPMFIDEKFDYVFTSYGTIGWLPDLNKWAKVISHFLKPNGELIMADFHPVVWMFDNDFNEVFYSYFNTEPIIEEETGTYAEKEALLSGKTISWNHPISEILNSLIKNDLDVICFNEHDYSPYNCFTGMEEFEPNKFRLKKFGNKIPMVYSLKARKK